MNSKWKKTAAVCMAGAALVLSVPAMASAATVEASPIAASAPGAASGAVPAIAANGKVVPASAAYLSADGRTFVNVASFAEALGVSYTPNADANTVTVGGETVEVELKDGQPYAHIRPLAAAAGASGVEWDAAANIVQVVYGAKLVVYGDTVSQLGECIVQNRFVVGDSIIFRMTALNSVTSQLEEGAKLQIHLSTGEVLDMQLGDHPPGAPNAEKFWSVRYEVTDKTPKGTLNYYVTAENDSGLKGEYRPFNVMPSLLTIVSADQAAPAESDAAGGGK